VLSIEHLPPSIIAFIILWQYWFPFCLIQTRPFGKAKRSYLLAQVALIVLKSIHLAKSFSLPTILLFINQNCLETVQYPPVTFHSKKFSVKLPKEPGEGTLTHSVLLFVQPLLPVHFYYTNLHQPRFNPFLWLPCSQNQSGNISCGTPILLHSSFGILDAIVFLHVGFIVHLPVVFAVIWIFQVTILVKPLFGFWNAFRCTTIIIFGRMAVDSCDSVDIEYLSSSSREVLCRQSWWHRWSFRHFKYSRTMMLKVWPWCFDDLFSIWNISYSSHWLVLSARFLLCGM